MKRRGGGGGLLEGGDLFEKGGLNRGFTILNKHCPMIYQTISLALLVLFFAAKKQSLCK